MTIPLGLYENYRPKTAIITIEKVGVNYIITAHKEEKVILDILYLIAQILYAFIFRIRNITLVRYIVIVPHCFAILYNVLLGGMQFVALSYTFELFADLYSIFRAKRSKKIQNT